MSEPKDPPPSPGGEPADATANLLAPRQRRHRSSSSSSRSSRSSRRRSGKSKSKRWIIALAVSGGTALIVLAAGLVLWTWRKPVPPPAMPVASLDEILAAKTVPDWLWWRLRENTAVLVLEFPSLIEQGEAMNRMAAFIEKRGGPRDRLLDNGELAELIKRSGDNAATFYSGHDYTMDRLAQFYTLADQPQQPPLNGQEQRLRENLLRWNILKRELDGSYHSTSERALVSFTAEQPDDPQTTQDELIDAKRRESVLRHELSHGEYFTNSNYRQQCWEFWRKSLTENERQMFRKYLAGLDYDPSNEELMVNETQAVLMHTPDTRAFSAQDLGISDVELERLRERFRSTK